MPKLLFLRSYLLIVVLIVAVGWVLDHLLMQYHEQANNGFDNRQLLGSFLYIENVLRRNPQDQGVTAFERLKPSLQTQLGFPLAAYRVGDFAGQQHIIESLSSGRIVPMATDNKTMIYYRQITPSQLIIAIGPLSEYKAPVVSDMTLIALYHILVAAALFLWLWPMSQDLHALRKAALEFSEENFEARVKLGKSSTIVAVADAFNTMARRIQTLISSHQDLTHAVSHELKTPLARFKFSMELLAGSEDRTQRKKYLNEMKQDACELDILIEELLRYAQFSAQNLTLNLEPIMIEQWLREIIEQYEQENIDLIFNSEIGAGDRIEMDQYLMMRAVNNVIRNALRYAKKRLDISLLYENNTINLRIDDDGPGIAEAYRQQVFQPFARLDSSRDRQSGGYGLGLAIAQKIVQQHGGEISVRDAPLGGARFELKWSISPRTITNINLP